MIGGPPSSAMPASKDSRGRVEGFSKIMTTDWGPASGLYENRSSFIFSARSRTPSTSEGLRSSSTRKWRRVIAGGPLVGWHRCSPGKGREGRSWMVPPGGAADELRHLVHQLVD